MTRESVESPESGSTPLATAATDARAVRVHAGGGRLDYTVLVGRGLLAQLPALLKANVRAQRWAVISDSTVASIYGEPLVEGLASSGLEARLLRFPAGERHKSRETWMSLTDALLEARFGRDTGIVALGGGVTGDIAGFVAATFLRGVPVVQVPTSLVAMIDASVGGKTGVDTPAGKNLVGAFHPPRLVVADTTTVRSLPVAERAQGLVEAVKHGAILDERYLRDLEANLERLLAGDPDATEDAVRRSVELKGMVVSKDEMEADYREILNFGHTLGHAVEAASAYALPHGTAVGLGMILEARLGERMDVTAKGTSTRLSMAVEGLGLPTRIPGGLGAPDVMAFLGVDKKRRGGRVRCVLLRSPGQVQGGERWSQPVDEAEVRRMLEESS